jgi:hypothetical protein
MPGIITQTDPDDGTISTLEIDAYEEEQPNGKKRFSATIEMTYDHEEMYIDLSGQELRGFIKTCQEVLERMEDAEREELEEWNTLSLLAQEVSRQEASVPDTELAHQVVQEQKEQRLQLSLKRSLQLDSPAH